MRVLYFHQHFSTPAGSIGTRSYEMARNLVARGHLVTMVCGSYKGGETGLVQPFRRGYRRGRVDSIDIIEIGLDYSNSDGFLRRILTFLRFALRGVVLVFSERYDIVFATTTPLTASIPGIFARWLRGRPFVFEVRDLWPELPKAMGVIRNPAVLGAMAILEWVAYRSAHRLIGLSPGIVDGIAAKGVDRARITMVPNGCDLEIFSGSVEPWRPANISATDLMAVFAGTHGIANGLHAVLDVALELKARKRDDIKLVLVGDGKLKPALESQSQRLGLDNIVFHAPVNKQQLARLMASADIGMQILANVPAFYFGTSPNKFFDYIAAGLPVLINYPGWLAQIILESGCGYVVAPNNPEVFADALESAAANRERLKAMGHLAHELAKQRFSRDLLAQQWVDWVTAART